MHEHRDSQVRIAAGIALTRAAKLAGVVPHTLRIYEIDPKAIRNDHTRAKCARYYRLLREFMAALAA